MPAIRPIELSDRPTIQAYLRRYPTEISELTFTNLFVWRASRPVFLVEAGDSMVFLTNTGDDGEKLVFGHPLGKASPHSIAQALGPEVAGYIRIPENTASILRDADFLITPDRDNADYVYRVADLTDLAGRRYHKKRNLIKQCLSAYSCQHEPVTPALIAECSDMQDRWCKVRACGREPGLCSEYVAIRELFDHFEELQLVGGAIRVDGILQAYAIAEELRPGTAVCHFEKAMPGFRGLGQLINHWFAKYTLQGFEYENREQDLGIPGLRQAKESYYPHHMVDKFSAWVSTPRPEMSLSIEPRECEKHEEAKSEGEVPPSSEGF